MTDFPDYIPDLNFNPQTDTVIVLRRYDSSTHPWGVHVVSRDVTVRSRYRNRPIGLFTTEDVLLLAQKNNLVSDDGNYDRGTPRGNAVGVTLDDYIWRQVVPMEWHGEREQLMYRVKWLMQIRCPECTSEVDWAEMEHWDPLPDFLAEDWAFRPAVAS